ncbi:MAG: proprotein convertase P-domain-containing protein [Phycisphaerae bacterium]
MRTRFLSRLLVPACMPFALSLPAAAATGLTYNSPICNPPPTSPAGCGSVPIPDLGSASATVFVPGNGDDIVDLITVQVWIQHTYQGDLRMTLTSPAGTTIVIQDRPGGGGFSADDFGGFTFDLGPTWYFAPFELADFAATPYDLPYVSAPGNAYTPYPCCGIPNPAFYTFKPTQPLSTFKGESKVGTWTLTVSDNAAVDTGSIRYFGVYINGVPIQQPFAEITAPAPFSCACNPTQIIGSANDPNGTYVGYSLEYASNPAGPWTLIASSFASVTNGVLGTWNTTGLSGYYFVRLTVINSLNLSSQFVTVLRPDANFGSAVITYPANNAIVGGSVCVKGTATDDCFDNYRVEYKAAGALSFTVLATSTSAVINDTLATLNSSLLPDGDYDIRLTGVTTCGLVASQQVRVTIDNTAPVATISSPTNCQTRSGVVPIVGTVSDAHLSGWVVQYTGGSVNGWVTIASGSAPLAGTLANWNTVGLPRCDYTVRVIASDLASVNCDRGSNSTEFDTSIQVGCPGDITRDGVVDSSDLGVLLSAWLSTCP